MPNPLGVVWTTAMIDRLKELTGDKDLAYRDIAAKLSYEFAVVLTKNACIGKGRRLALPMRQPGMSRPGRLVKVEKPRYIKIKVDAPIQPVVPPRHIEGGLTIYELREGDCKWVLSATGTRPPFIYCGQPSLFGKPWCKTHHEMAYSSVRERSA